MRLKKIYLGDDPCLITLIAQWYESEWQIPGERSKDDLREKLDKTIPLQLVILRDEVAVATGGIYKHVRLDFEPRFTRHSPWLALMHVVPDFRGKGIGTYLCDSLDAAVKQGLTKYYTSTHILLKDST
jgi:GNAT superfamily N-acetyltransferase